MLGIPIIREEAQFGVKSPDKFVQLTMDHTKSAFEMFVAEATKIGNLYKDFAKEAFTLFKLKS